LVSLRNLGLLLVFGVLLVLPYRIALSGETQGKRKTGARQAKFEPFGTYVIYGDRSEAFGDFNVFIIGYPRKPVKGQPDKIIGEVQFGRREILIAEFVGLKLIDTALSFETEEKNGISYTFEGRFLRKGDFLKRPPGYTPVLEGTLIKKLNGKEVAKESLKFYYEVIDK
jgi:hypothetical protein